MKLNKISDRIYRLPNEKEKRKKSYVLDYLKERLKNKQNLRFV